MTIDTSSRLMSYKADLHVHSALSPCAEDGMNPEEVLRWIKKFGIDILSVTDHNSGSNCAAFDSAARKGGVIFIPGIEVQSSEEVHLLGYFPDIISLQNFCTVAVEPGIIKGKKNVPHQFGNQVLFDVSGMKIGEAEDLLSMPLSLSIDELVDHIHRFMGIAVAAHIDRGFSIISQLGYIPLELELDAVEIWDTNKIEKMQSSYLAGRDLNIISSSDTHYITMMKKPKMKFWLEGADVQSCLDCIKGDGTGRITIAANGKRDHRKRMEKYLQKEKKPSRRDWQSLYKH